MKNFIKLNLIISLGLILILIGSCKEPISNNIGSSKSYSLKSGGIPLSEAESLVATTSGQHPAEVFAEAGASNGNNSLLQSTAVGEWIQYTINVLSTGSYNVKVMLCKNNLRGMGKLYLDGSPTNTGPELDLYGASGYTYQLVDMGNVTLTAGDHTFKFAVTGKNASSSSWKLSFDYIDLTPADALVTNPTFDTNTTGWALANTSPAASTFASVTQTGYSGNACKVTITNGGSSYSMIEVTQDIALVSGNTYSITFKASADAARTMRVCFQQIVSPWTTYFQTSDIDITTTPTTYGPFTYACTTTSTQRFKFYMGGSAADVWIDDVVITTGAGASIPTLAATTAASAITSTTATSGGNVTSDGGASVTARGVCWSTSQNPTTADPKTTDGTGTGTFTSAITGLTASTLYYVRSYATNSSGTAYGAQVSFTTLAAVNLVTNPTFDTNTTGWALANTAPAASTFASVTQTGYSGKACKVTITNGGTSYSMIEVTQDIGLISGNTYSITFKASSDAARTMRVCFQQIVSPWTTYFQTTDFNITTTPTTYGPFTYACTTTSTQRFKFYVGGSAADVWVDDVVVNTGSGATVPTLAATTAASAITSTTATSGGNVTSDGGASVTARGVCWSTSQNPTTADPKTTDGTGTGTYTSAITGLTASTLYYVRSYATNSAGTAYGTQVSFTTLAIPTLAATTAASAITSTTATSGGNVTSDGGASVTARGVCWSTSQNPTTADPKTTDGTGTGTFTSAITGLTASTLYYVRSYATNSVGTAYGAQASFTTSDGTWSKDDPRAKTWVHPGRTWASYESNYNLYTDYVTGGGGHVLNTLSEPGYLAHIGGVPQAGVYTLSKVADPDDGSKLAFMHKVSSSWDQFDPDGNQTSRAEFDRRDVLMEGVEYWCVTAYRFDTDCFGHAGHNIDIGDIHEQNWSPVTPGANITGGVMNAMFLDDATTTKWYWRNKWCTAYPPLVPGPDSGSQDLAVVTAPVTNTWYYVIRKVKLHWDNAQGPYSTVWVAIGNGALNQISTRTGPNAYNLDNNLYYPKTGVYKWDQTWGSKSTRTLWTKGMFVFTTDAPGSGYPVIDQNSLLTFLRSI